MDMDSPPPPPIKKNIPPPPGFRTEQVAPQPGIPPPPTSMNDGIFGAGICPITFYNGEMYLFLGKDKMDNTFSDFGGRCELEDKGNSLNTAMREFYEETCGIIMDMKSLKNRMSNKDNYTTVYSKTQKGYNYYMYILQIPYNPSYRAIYRKLTYYMKWKKLYKVMMEKNDVVFVSLASLVKNEKLMLRKVFENTFRNNVQTFIDLERSMKSLHETLGAS